MLENESKWIGRALSKIPAKELTPCVNLGSSTIEFRRSIQPFIYSQIIAPNELRGIKFIHADIKKEPGVDVAGDIFDLAFQSRLQALRPNCILCCNILEHVDDKERLAKICAQIVAPGGYIVVSVPRSFPYHLDPIDTYYRPTTADLLALFPGFVAVASEVVSDISYAKELAKMAFTDRLIALSKIALHSLVPFYKWERWKSRVHPMMWLCRPYSVSIAVLKKGAPPGAVVPCQ